MHTWVVAHAGCSAGAHRSASRQTAAGGSGLHPSQTASSRMVEQDAAADEQTLSSRQWRTTPAALGSSRPTWIGSSAVSAQRITVGWHVSMSRSAERKSRPLSAIVTSLSALAAVSCDDCCCCCCRRRYGGRKGKEEEEAAEEALAVAVALVAFVVVRLSNAA